MTTAGIASLITGMIIGYMGQRSRMCFVGGIRDYIIIRDTNLLKGVLAFFIAALLAFQVFGLISPESIGSLPQPDLLSLVFVILGGFGVGIFSTLSNGCPFRQHVLAAQGIFSSITYLAGFFFGAVAFHAFVMPTLLRILP